MEEHWLPIPGYDFYEVSDQGRVRSIDRIANSRWGTPKRVQGKVLRQVRTGRYLGVTLYMDGVPRAHMVHRLVLLAFVGPCPDGQQGLHFDDDGTNNLLPNLRWGTPSENAHDCIRNGFHPKTAITHCPRGHEYDEENTYVVERSGHRQCRNCNNARAEAKKTRPHSRDRTHCPQGHAYDDANTYRVAGRRVCRTCSRDKAREYQRNKRAQQLRTLG